MDGYKVLITDDEKYVICKLDIPDDALTNLYRTNIVDKEKASYRCSRAMVVSIEDLEGNKYESAKSLFDPSKKRDEQFDVVYEDVKPYVPLTYTVGYLVTSEFNYSIDVENTTGIHYYNNRDMCVRLINYLLKKDGVHKTYNLQGMIFCKCEYKNGKLYDDYVIYYDNGNIMAEARYNEHGLDGKLFNYYRNKKLDSIYNYKDGKRHGLSVNYNASHNDNWITSVLQYNEDKLVVYKVVKVGEDKYAICTLEIPRDVKTNIYKKYVNSRMKASYRANKANVINIEDLDGNKYESATSLYHDELKDLPKYTELKYLINTTLTIDNYDDNNNYEHNNNYTGIYFYLDKDMATNLIKRLMKCDGTYNIYCPFSGRRLYTITYKDKKEIEKVEYDKDGWPLRRFENGFEVANYSRDNCCVIS